MPSLETKKVMGMWWFIALVDRWWRAIRSIVWLVVEIERCPTSVR